MNNARRKYRPRRKYGRPFLRRTGGIKGMVRRTINSVAETKYRVVVFGQNLTTSPVTTSFIDGITLGTNTDNRIGQKIQTRTLTYHLNFYYNYNPTGVTSFGMVRFMVLYPRKSVSSSTLLAYLSAIVPGMNGLIAPNYAYVLLDKTFQLSSASILGGLQGSPSFMQLKGKVNLKPTTFYFPAGDNVDREPMIYMISNCGPANTDTVYVAGYLRTSFKDI